MGVICIFLQLGLTLFAPIKKKGAVFATNIFLFLIWYLFEFIFSCTKYGQGAVNVFITSNYCFILLLYFTVRYYLIYFSIDDFNEIVVSISLINMVLHLIQKVLYPGFLFLFFDENNMRMGELRLGHSTSALTLLGFFIAFCKIMTPQAKRSIKHYLTVFMGIASTFLVSRGRFTIIAVFITIIYILCYVYKKNAIKIIFGALAVAIVVVVFLKFTSLGQSYMTSLTLEDTGSFRLLEMDYYWNSLKQNPIFGMGFIRQMGFVDQATHLVTGPNYHFSRTDVGLVGLASTFGLVGLIWYVLLLLKMRRMIWKKRTGMVNELEMLVRSIFVWNLIYIPTMILFGPFSISVFAIELAYIDYFYTNSISEYC